MKKYRKPDQYYLDEYDRQTISLLKELEFQEALAKSNVTTLEEEQRVIIEQHTSLGAFYHNAVMRAKNREDFVRVSRQRDEGYDRLVAKYPQPENIRCRTCKSLMILCAHFFDEGDTEILFVFECTDAHSPRRAIYPNGREFLFPERKCQKCGGE